MVCCFGAQAADQAIQLEHRSSDSDPLYSPAEETAAFWQKFKASFDNRANDVFADRFNSFRMISWGLYPADRDTQDFLGRPVRAARSALTKSLTYSFRDSVFDLPGMVWLKDRPGFISELIRDSIGNPGEDSVTTKNLAYKGLEQTWWESMSERGGLSYGIQPFRSSPYAFFSWSMKDGDQTLLLGHMRYYYQNFIEHNFEMALSIPITRGITMGFGCAYKFDNHTNDKSASLTISKVFRNGGILNLGAEVTSHPALFAGFAKAW